MINVLRIIWYFILAWLIIVAGVVLLLSSYYVVQGIMRILENLISKLF